MLDMFFNEDANVLQQLCCAQTRSTQHPLSTITKSNAQTSMHAKKMRLQRLFAYNPLQSLKNLKAK